MVASPDVVAAVSEILDQISACARQFPYPRDPVPGRLEVGTLLHQTLREAAGRADGATPWAPPPALFGVQIVPREDLEPVAWRLLDTDGELIREGAVLTEERFWAQVPTDSKRTVVCSPGLEPRVKGWVEARGVGGIITVVANRYVPDGGVYVVDERALEI